MWDRILSGVARRISGENFEIWFKPTRAYGEIEQEKRLLVKVPNRQFQRWLLEMFGEVIEEVKRELGLESYEVSFCVGEPEERAEGEEAVELRGRPQGNGNGHGGLNSKYRFENFVVGYSNELAHAVSKAVSKEPGRTYNPLFIYGGVGLGKTHLMHAIGHRIRSNYPQVRLTYMSSERFVNELVHSLQDKRMTEFRAKYRTMDVLLMDDVQFIGGKERTQEEFFHTFNVLYEGGKQIIISSDSPPQKIPMLEKRLHSRFEWGLIADIQVPDLETKMAILRKKAEEQGVKLPEEVVMFVASNVHSSVRELEGALVRLMAYRSLTGEAITLEMSRRVLRQLTEKQARVVTIEEIQKRVAEHYSLQVRELKARCNARRVSEPRQVAMFLSKELTGRSLSEIGRAFGNKHHTTVLHAIRKVETLKENDSRVYTTLDRIGTSLR